MVSRVICAQAGLIPQMNSAGMVNNTPEATEELAEPTVCDMLLSRMLWRRPKAVNTRNATTVRTATGIEVLIVSPALSPR